MSRPLTIQEALKQMIESERFKALARIDPATRVYSGRIRKGKLSGGAAIRLLEDFGFKIYAVEVSDKSGKLHSQDRIVA